MDTQTTAEDRERARRAKLHQQIGALETKLATMGHIHSIYSVSRGECAICRAGGVSTRVAGYCASCATLLCSTHLLERVFYNDREKAKFHRLRSKINTLLFELKQPELI